MLELETEAIMSQTEVLLKELEKLPTDYFSEVINFILFLQQRQKKACSETMLMSESSLSKEWDTPEEDAAWASL
jgi:hypothetical protein